MDFSYRSLAGEALESGLLLPCNGFCSILFVTGILVSIGVNEYLNEASAQPVQQRDQGWDSGAEGEVGRGCRENLGYVFWVRWDWAGE